jgi:hypothetical protein
MGLNSCQVTRRDVDVLGTLLFGPLNDDSNHESQASTSQQHNIVDADNALFDSQSVLRVDSLTDRSRTIARHAFGLAGIRAQHGLDRTLQVRAEEDIDAIFGYATTQILGQDGDFVVAWSGSGRLVEVSRAL